MKKVFKFIPCLLGFGALIGCGGGNNPTLVGIDASFVDNVNRFMVGDTLSKNKIKVVANYSNSTKKEVTDWTCEEFKDKETYTFSETDVTKNKFTIAYSNKTTDLNITVLKTKSSGINWLGNIIDLGDGNLTSCRALAKISNEIYFGKPKTYQSEISGLTAHPCNEEGASDIINLYYDNRTASNIKMYVLSDNKIIIRDNDNVDNNRLFKGCIANTITLNNIDTTQLTSMYEMFCECKNLTRLDLTNFDSTNVKSMSRTFFNCKALIELNVSSLNTENVEKMQQTFSSCENLQELNLANFNTSKVKNMGNMFSSCYKLKSVDLSTFDTSNVERIDYMFFDCKSLESINFDNFNTSNVSKMEAVFLYCSKLKTLDLSTFDTSNVKTIEQMFEGCRALQTIYASKKFVTTACTLQTSFSRTFFSCSALIGGNGTKYDNNHVDGDYARIDTAENPGYFTKKQTLAHDGEWYSYKKEGAVAKDITCKFIATRDSNHNFAYFGMSNYAGTTPYFNIGYQDATQKVNVLSISKDDGNTITPLTFGDKGKADAYKYGNDLIVFNSSLFPIGYKIIIECTITTALDAGFWAYVGSYN